MKLSRREKILISILIIAVIIYFSYTYLPRTNLFNLEALREEYNQKSVAYNIMSQNIILKSSMEEKYQELESEINSLNVISDMQQENIIVFLNNYYSKSTVDANGLSFTEMTAAPMDTVTVSAEPKAPSTIESIMDEINVKVKEKDPTDSTGTDNGSDGNKSSSTDTEAKSLLSANSISVTAAFQGTYANLISFIDSIQNNPVDISIPTINLVSAEGGIIQGTMVLNFYEIPKLESFIEANQEWIWKELTQSGKSNPFSSEGGGFNTSAAAGFDFYLSVVPESSDLPTIMAGVSGDRERKTYVYEDSNKIENIFFNFKKENDKYFYKYNTRSSAYPASGAWSEFVPSAGNSINIKVYSSARNSKTDSSGANISVSNTTGLKVRFEIEDDDKTVPRIYFKDPKTVTVTRK